jgi:hypothetical protein
VHDWEQERQNTAAERVRAAAGNGQLLDLAERCARIWSALPQLESGRILLTELAATALDDPHALDRGSSTATAVLRLLGHDLPDSAEAWRMAWEEHGIDRDPVSSRVLVLSLPLDGDAPCARLAQAAGPEPLWLTLFPHRIIPDGSARFGRVRLRAPLSAHRRGRSARHVFSRGASKPGLPARHATRNRTCPSSCGTYAAPAPDSIQ